MELYQRTLERSIPREDKEKIINWFLWTSGHYQMARISSKNKINFILDEGFIHKIISIFVSTSENKINFNEIKEYILKIPKTDLLIYTHADLKVCKERIMARKLPERLEGKKEKEVEEYLFRSQKALSFAIESLADSGMAIINIDNSSNSLDKSKINEQLFFERDKILNNIETRS